MGCVRYDSTYLCVSKCERVGGLHRKQRYLSATKKYQATGCLKSFPSIGVAAVHAPSCCLSLTLYIFHLLSRKTGRGGAIPYAFPARSPWLATDCSVEMSILAIVPSRDGWFLNMQAYISLSAHPRH